MSFPTYAEYKYSGVEWLGDVPAGWSVIRLSRLAKEEQNAFTDGDWIESPYITDEGVRLIQTGNVGIGQYREQGFRYVSESTVSDLNCTEIEAGDVLICRLAAPVGRACIAPALDTRMITAVDVCILKPNENTLARYVVYMLSSAEYLGFMESKCRGGTRDRVSRSFLGSVQLAIPPRIEQTAIANFLDSETSKIDALVAEQRRLIELLKEKRQAVISHAVTKGLNPNAHMKPSGIPWLGDVPEHWVVVKLKRVAVVLTGVAKGKDHTGKKTINVPYLRVANVQDGYLDLDDVTTIDILEHELERYRLNNGDVLMNEGGDFDKLGRGHIWEDQIDPCITQNHVFAVRPTAVQSHWLNCITSSDYAQFYFMSHSKQSTNLASISSTNLMKLPVILPPTEEQCAILDFIRESIDSFNSLLGEAERAIKLLQEHRTALISAAVTGKIDVREFAFKESV